MVIGMLIICIKKWTSRQPAHPVLQSNITPVFNISNQISRNRAVEEDQTEHVEGIEMQSISRIINVRPIDPDVETRDMVEQLPNGIRI